MKKTLKSLIFICLILCMFVILIPNTVFASEAVEVPIEGFNYTTNASGVTITGIKTDWYIQKFGSNTTSSTLIITIPDEINGQKVVAISDLAFTAYGESKYGWPIFRPFYLESIDFSETTALAGIGPNAFNRQTLLTSISLPDTVTTIGNSAFRECSNLTEVTLSDNITSIGEYAFYNNYNISAVRVNGGDPDATFELPSNIVSIGQNAFGNIFRYVTDDIAFKIPASTTTVGNASFLNWNAPYVTITVEGSSPYTGFNNSAFNIKGSTTSSLARIAIVFPSQADYSAYTTIRHQATGVHTHMKWISISIMQHPPFHQRRRYSINPFNTLKTQMVFGA